MKYAILTYQEDIQTFNVGDNIQSLAAKQFLPRVDFLLNRERLAEYNGPPVKLIMNGWFTHNTTNWVPSENIVPLFVSFHINEMVASSMLSDTGIAYLKKHEPIGCRDRKTVTRLEEKGIRAYYTGCLTLTLGSYQIPEVDRSGSIYIVDHLCNYPSAEKIFYNYKYFLRGIQYGTIFRLAKRQLHLKKMVSKQILDQAEFIKQEPPSGKYTDTQKFELAETLLRKYAAAKLVITSRIHCALPCLALGTPVIFINSFANNSVASCRFDGILELFNHIDIDDKTGYYTANFQLDNGQVTDQTILNNPKAHKKISIDLKRRCEEFICD